MYEYIRTPKCYWQLTVSFSWLARTGSSATLQTYLLFYKLLLLFRVMYYIFVI